MMDRQVIIDDTVSKINKLPKNKLIEINDFIDFLLSRIDDKIITENIQELTSESDAFDFLKEDEEIYEESDLKEKY